MSATTTVVALVAFLLPRSASLGFYPSSHLIRVCFLCPFLFFFFGLTHLLLAVCFTSRWLDPMWVIPASYVPIIVSSPTPDTYLLS
jgi:hypothetical protein